MGATRLELPDLAGLRRQQGISLGQIADTTKIGLRYLEQIERGQFAKLPGGIYNTSYIRQYARAIGFPEDRLLRVYRNTYLPKFSFDHLRE
ncbi:MAG TPA: helix-turn-helix domain-containing protein [Candidatus Acidoferrales bacterium]|nr:helix-turn-helix domain-containing protein [Candidatus Acidoferrales bacterium]